MTDRSKELNEFFQETYILFGKTTQYAKLLENLGGVVQVTYINELRSVLFHLYGYLNDDCASDPKKLQTQYFGAREHIFRAYYDLFSLICVLSIKEITKYSEDYGKKLLHTIYPDYFSKILPELLIVQQKISNIQSVNEVSTGIDPELTILEKINKNDGYITALMNWNNQLTVRTGLFVEYKDKEKLEEEKEIVRRVEHKNAEEKADHKFWLKIYVQVAIGLGGIILGVLLSHYWPTNPNRDNNPPINNSKPITSKPSK